MNIKAGEASGALEAEAASRERFAQSKGFEPGSREAGGNAGALRHGGRWDEPDRAVVAVIPAHNEERFIGSVVLGARHFAHTVVVVDDGSSDRTAQLAADAGAIVVQCPSQQGKARALTMGFSEARRHAADVVVMLDGDAQHDPSEIPRLVTPILDGAADVVIGSRFLEPARAPGAPGWRRVGQRALTAATNAASGLALTDSQSGFRALSGAVVSQLSLSSRGLAAESEMQFWLSETVPSDRVLEVPITVSYRDAMKRNPVAHGLVVLNTLVQLVERRHPLLLMTAPGVACALAGTWIGTVVLHDAVRGGRISPIYGAAAFLLFISGLLLAVTGTLLHRLEDFQTATKDLLWRDRTPTGLPPSGGNPL